MPTMLEPSLPQLSQDNRKGEVLGMALITSLEHKVWKVQIKLFLETWRYSYRRTCTQGTEEGNGDSSQLQHRIK